MGSNIYKDGKVLKLPEFFAEVRSCTECEYQGPEIIEGNERLHEFLVAKRDQKIAAARMNEQRLQQKIDDLKETIEKKEEQAMQPVVVPVALPVVVETKSGEQTAGM